MADAKSIVKGGTMMIGKGGIAPQSMDDLWRLSGAIARSSLCPRGMSQDDVFLCLDYGLALGLPWSMATSTVAIINGKPVIYGRGMLGVVRASGFLEDVQESFEGTPGTDEYTAVCTLKRRGQATPKDGRFSVADAKRARLWGKSGPWAEHPNNQLMWRARGRAYGELFADVLLGLHIAEETEGDDYSPRPKPALEEAVMAGEHQDPPEPVGEKDAEAIGEAWPTLPGMSDIPREHDGQAEVLPRSSRKNRGGAAATIDEIDAAMGGAE